MSSTDRVDELVQAVHDGQCRGPTLSAVRWSRRLELSLGLLASCCSVPIQQSRMDSWLIEEGGADVNVRRSFLPVGVKPSSRSFVQSSRSKYQKVRLLLKNNADVNLTCYEGETPLHIACLRHGEEDSIMLVALLEGGADVKIRDSRGCTPVFAACRRGHLSILRLLVEHYGADINVGNVHGLTL